jgi:hypothetical protein
MPPYSNTKYLWLEKDVEKLQKKPPEIEKISFNENEFKDLVNPILKTEILTSLQPLQEKNLIFENILKELKNQILSQQTFYENHLHEKSLPIWVPITLSVLSTSLFFTLIILFSYIFKN